MLDYVLHSTGMVSFRHFVFVSLKFFMLSRNTDGTLYLCIWVMARAFSVLVTSATQSKALLMTFLSSLGFATNSTVLLSTGKNASWWRVPKLRHSSFRLYRAVCLLMACSSSSCPPTWPQPRLTMFRRSSMSSSSTATLKREKD